MTTASLDSSGSILDGVCADTSIRTAEHLVSAIEGAVLDGSLGPGASIPSVRAIAGACGIAPNTAAKAYRRLRDRGVVVGRGRQGTVIADRPAVLSSPVVRIPPGIVDAASGNPDARLLPDLVGPMTSAASAPARYGDAMVAADLATVARRWLASDGVDAEHLTLTFGAMDAIERLLVGHVRLGDRVAVEDPGHRPVHDLVRVMGLDPVAVPIDESGMRPGPLRAALDGGARVVIITPRAQNPTGAALDPARAAEIDAVLVDHPDVLVIEDDHAGPVAGLDLHGLGRERRSWALVRSVSKSLGPDLRLAFVVGDRDTVDRIEARLSIGPGWISHLVQQAVASLLGDPQTTALMRRAANRYAERRQLLVDRLAAHGVVAGRSGVNVWIPVIDEQPVVDAARDAGFAIRAGAGYRIGSTPAVRVTVAALDDREIAQLGDVIGETSGTARPDGSSSRSRTA